MISNYAFNKHLIAKIKKAINIEAKNIVMLVQSDYAQVNVKGEAKSWYKYKQIAQDMLMLTVFGEGQKALIGEYGKGSKLDRSNPALQDYINSDIFNKERLKHNFATLTRPRISYDDYYYYDLDGRRYKKKAKKVKNLENSGSPRYNPIEPKHIIAKAIEQRLDSLSRTIQEIIITEVAFYKLIDGLKIKIHI